MPTEQVKLLLIITVISVLSGLADSQGFIHASKIWVNNKWVWNEVGKSALGFAVGITLYWIVLKYMHAAGIVAPEIQTLIWFSITILGVALISRSFFRWQTIDQIVGVAVLAGVGWLLVCTGGG
jgi:hypothetical protein